jgi:hypothetical protein
MTTKHLPIVCGTTTCYDFESKKMCRFVLTSHFGKYWLCGVYRDRDGNFENLQEDKPAGSLQRLPQCLEEIK